MWKDRGEFRKRPRNSWIFENRIAGNDSSGASSGFCSNASTISSFEFSVGKILEFQTAHFLVFTDTERTFVVSIIHLSFIK